MSAIFVHPFKTIQVTDSLRRPITSASVTHSNFAFGSSLLWRAPIIAFASSFSYRYNVLRTKDDKERSWRKDPTILLSIHTTTWTKNYLEKPARNEDNWVPIIYLSCNQASQFKIQKIQNGDKMAMKRAMPHESASCFLPLYACTLSSYAVLSDIGLEEPKLNGFHPVESLF